MSITNDQLASIAGSGGNVLTKDGDKIGGVGQVYVDETTGEPTWVTAKTGLFGTSENFVPLHGAEVDGIDVLVGYTKEVVKDAPRIDADGSISPEEEEALYSYYGLDNPSGIYASADLDLHEGDEGRAEREDVGSERDAVGHDTSGPTTDEAMTRSEERLNVGTRTQESARARLRKYVVVENVTQTIPVRREEVRVEREPITEENMDAAMAGPEISDEEHEVILHAERPVVEKEVVPVERVRLDTDTVTDDVSVTEDVRKEQISADLDRDRAR